MTNKIASTAIELCDVHEPLCSHNCHSIHQFAESLGNAIDAKDAHTRQHSEEVAILAYALAVECGSGQDEACAVHIAGHLHDLGKIAIPDFILHKAGPLTPQEWAIVREHPRIGAQIVAPVSALNQHQGVAEMILHHHERYDGSGYPFGLVGSAIPYGARVLSVADCVSAIMQDRHYRRGRSLQEAIQEIAALAGKQFDPAIAAALPKVVAAALGGAGRVEGISSADFFGLVSEKWWMQMPSGTIDQVA